MQTRHAKEADVTPGQPKRRYDLEWLRVLAVLLLVPFLTAGHPLPQPPVVPVLVHLVYYFSRWCWLVAILGLGRRYLNVNNRSLRYASEASYPFYLLHFLVNTAIAHHVVRWDVGVAVKYLVITIATVLVTYAVYDLLLKRTRVPRFLFGMRRKRGAQLQPLTIGDVWRSRWNRPGEGA